MRVKMIASRRYYAKDEGKEYAPGQSFMAASEDEAGMLERRRKATRAPADAPKPAARPAEQPKAPAATRRTAPRAEQAPPPAAPSPAPLLETPAPQPSSVDAEAAGKAEQPDSAPGYSRRDMTAERS